MTTERDNEELSLTGSFRVTYEWVAVMKGGSRKRVRKRRLKAVRRRSSA
jgi:hypothetical protein